MTAADVPPPIRRILVALDASGASLSALDAAARLAEQMEAELLGLFVEDVNLLRLAGLPFAREVGLTLAHARPLASADMERALRAQAVRAQQALEQAATRLSVRCSFRVVRGQVTEELLAAAEEVDLVAIGLSGQTLSRARPGTTAGAMAAGTTRPMLFLPRDATIRPPVMVIYNGSAAGERALALAVRLAQAEQWPLTVWIAGKDEKQRKKLQGEAERALEDSELTATLRAWRDHDLTELLREVYRDRGATLVLPTGIASIEREQLTQVLEQAGGAVLLVC